MIDELAKALCEDAGWKWCRHPVLDERYRRRVRTVLRRLREPTPEMIDAAARLGFGPRPESISEIFTAMIDAALGERGA